MRIAVWRYNRRMQVKVEIPDQFASFLVPPGSDAGRRLLEDSVAAAYRERRLTVEQVAVSGRNTQYTKDEFGLVFTRGTGPDREQRVTRYSPLGAKSRELSLGQLSDRELADLLAHSQPAWTAPELGYRR